VFSTALACYYSWCQCSPQPWPVITAGCQCSPQPWPVITAGCQCSPQPWPVITAGATASVLHSLSLLLQLVPLFSTALACYYSWLPVFSTALACYYSWCQCSPQSITAGASVLHSLSLSLQLVPVIQKMCTFGMLSGLLHLLMAQNYNCGPRCLETVKIQIWPKLGNYHQVRPNQGQGKQGVTTKLHSPHSGFSHPQDYAYQPLLCYR
jgi:hypothetical protein